MTEKQYGLDDLPNEYTTTADIENEMGIDDQEAIARLFVYLESLGFGRVFTQIDGDDGERAYIEGYLPARGFGAFALVRVSK